MQARLMQGALQLITNGMLTTFLILRFERCGVPILVEPHFNEVENPGYRWVQQKTEPWIQEGAANDFLSFEKGSSDKSMHAGMQAYTLLLLCFCPIFGLGLARNWRQKQHCMHLHVCCVVIAAILLQRLPKLVCITCKECYVYTSEVGENRAAILLQRLAKLVCITCKECHVYTTKVAQTCVHNLQEMPHLYYRGWPRPRVYHLRNATFHNVLKIFT